MTTAKKPVQGHDIVVTTAFELIGVGLLAILADMSEGLGKILVALMIGFALVWVMTHVAFLQRVIP